MVRPPGPVVGEASVRAVPQSRLGRRFGWQASGSGGAAEPAGEPSCGPPPPSWCDRPSSASAPRWEAPRSATSRRGLDLGQRRDDRCGKREKRAERSQVAHSRVDMAASMCQYRTGRGRGGRQTFAGSRGATAHLGGDRRPRGGCPPGRRVHPGTPRKAHRSPPKRHGAN